MLIGTSSILAELLNAHNPSSTVPTESDATVVGGGIHGLIYAIHTRLVHPEADLKITVLEKAAKPQWKVRVQIQLKL